MNHSLRMKAAITGYIATITILLLQSGQDMLLSAIVNAICVYLIYMIFDHYKASRREKLRLKYKIGLNKNKLIKHRFWLNFSIVMSVVFAIKNYELIKYIIETQKC